MDTTDDPVSAGALGLGIFGAVQASPVTQLSEAAKRNRRLAASMLTKEFAAPTLGTPALLG
ncbi:MAG: hypothetical protein ACYS1A_17700 [Planctomycetota bacterium]|jgi:hypothetical protein